MVAAGESLHEDVGSNIDGNIDNICQTTVDISENCVQSECQALCDAKFPNVNHDAYCLSISQFIQCNCRQFC